MKKRKKYLSIEEKRELAHAGKQVPICAYGGETNNSFITKMRTIWDGSLKDKKMKL